MNIMNNIFKIIIIFAIFCKIFMHKITWMYPSYPIQTIILITLQTNFYMILHRMNRIQFMTYLFVFYTNTK